MSNDSALSPVASRMLLIMNNKGLNLSQFAREIGIPQPNLSDIKNGKSKLTLPVFIAVCQRFNVSPLWLAFGSGPTYITSTSFLDSGFNPIIQSEEAQKNTPPDQVVFYDMIGRGMDSAAFRCRFPDIVAPGLYQILDHPELRERLNLTGEELQLMVNTIKNQPVLYRHAPASVFLQMLQSYRMDQLDGIEMIIETLGQKKS